MQSVTDFPWKPAHVTGTDLISSGGGALHSITVNGLTTAGDATVYDGVDATGTVIAVLHLDPATSISVQPLTFIYDVEMVTGIYIAFDQALAADLTVSYK